MEAPRRGASIFLGTEKAVAEKAFGTALLFRMAVPKQI